MVVACWRNIPFIRMLHVGVKKISLDYHVFFFIFRDWHFFYHSLITVIIVMVCKTWSLVQRWPHIDRS